MPTGGARSPAASIQAARAGVAKRLNCPNYRKRFIGLQSLAFAVVTSIAAKN